MSQATHNVLLLTTAGASAASGVALLAAPGPAWAFLDLAPDASGIWVSRLLGVACLALASLAFLARGLAGLDARRVVDAALLVAFAGEAAVGMWAQYLRVLNAWGWVPVAAAGAFAVAYFYFLAGEDRASLGIRARPT